MTAEEWVVTLNQLITKTRVGRLCWSADESGQASRAAVGGFTLTLEYVALEVHQAIRPRPDSLVLTLRNTAGETVALLNEAECRATPSQADNLALAQLFEAVVVEPRRRAESDFRQALGEL
jgi:hypothetical protein